MRWMKPNLRNSIYNLLGAKPIEQPVETTEDTERRTEDIRRAMMDSLGAQASKHSPDTLRRVRFAGDIQSLWFLRGELMAAVSQLHGELIASQKIGQISELFHGLLPSSLAARRTTLSSQATTTSPEAATKFPGG